MVDKIIVVNDLEKQGNKPLWGYMGAIVATRPDLVRVELLQDVKMPTIRAGVTRRFTEAKITLNKPLPNGDYVLLRQKNIHDKYYWLPLYGSPSWLMRLESYKNWLGNSQVLKAAQEFILSQCAERDKSAALHMMKDAEETLRKNLPKHIARQEAYRTHMDLANLVLPDPKLLSSKDKKAALQSNLKAKAMPISIAKALGMQKFPFEEPRCQSIPKNLFVIWEFPVHHSELEGN